MGFLCGISTLPILFFVIWVSTYGIQMAVWQSYQFKIPDTECQLIFYWKSLHPFLAEYDRKVQLICNNNKSPEYWLHTNTGGRHQLNLYILETKQDVWLKILDEFSECVINIKTLQGYTVGRRFGKTFVAPPQKDGYWGYAWPGNKAENLEAFIGETKGIYDPRFLPCGKYIGSLDGRSGSLKFIPVTEKPEEHIKTMEEQAEEMDKNVEQTN